MKNFMIICAAVVFAASAMAATPATASLDDVNCGSAVKITATPETGFHFVQWEDGNTENPRTISDINDETPKNYKAIFAANQAIDPSIDDPNNPTPNPGDLLSLVPKTNDECLEFDHWSDLAPGDADYAANPRSFTYEGVAPTFSAVWKTKVFSVSVSADDNTQGSVTIAPVVP